MNRYRYEATREINRRHRILRRPLQPPASGRALCRAKWAAPNPVLCRPGRATSRCGFSETDSSPQRLHVGIAGAEMLQDDERIRRAAIFDAHTVARGLRRDE